MSGRRRDLEFQRSLQRPKFWELHQPCRLWWGRRPAGVSTRRRRVWTSLPSWVISV